MWLYYLKDVNHTILKKLALQIFGVLVQILLNVNLSLNQTPGILALYKTNLHDSTDSGNFCGRGYLPLI